MTMPSERAIDRIECPCSCKTRISRSRLACIDSSSKRLNKFVKPFGAHGELVENRAAPSVGFRRRRQHQPLNLVDQSFYARHKSILSWMQREQARVTPLRLQWCR